MGNLSGDLRQLTAIIALWYGDGCFYTDLSSVLLKIDYFSISKERAGERAKKSGSTGLYEQIKKCSGQRVWALNTGSFHSLPGWQCRVVAGKMQNCSDMLAFHASSWNEQGCKAAVWGHYVLQRDAKQNYCAEDCEMMKILTWWLMCFLSVSLFEIHDCTSQKAASWLNPLHWFSFLHQTSGDKKTWKYSWLENIAGTGMRWQLKSQTLGWSKQAQN